MTPKEYAQYIADLLTPIGTISIKSMFGGIGLYNDGLIFGFVIEESLYFKVDGQTQPHYESRHSAPFTYEFKPKTENARPKKGQMPYWQVPEDIIEDQDMLIEWAQEAYQVSIRTQSKAKKR